MPTAAANGVNEDQAGGMSMEGGVPVVTRNRHWLNMDKIAECREISQSAWLYFPHVELVYLLFAFEGAVAAQVAAVRRGDSSLVVFILAMSYLVSLCTVSLVVPLAFVCTTCRAYFFNTSRVSIGAKLPEVCHLLRDPTPTCRVSRLHGSAFLEIACSFFLSPVRASIFRLSIPFS